MRAPLSIPNRISFWIWHAPTTLFAALLLIVALPTVLVLGTLFPGLRRPYLTPFLNWGADWADRMSQKANKDLDRLMKR